MAFGEMPNANSRPEIRKRGGKRSLRRNVAPRSTERLDIGGIDIIITRTLLVMQTHTGMLEWPYVMIPGKKFRIYKLPI